MMEGVHLDRVTALFAERDAALRQALCLYAESSEAVEVCAVVETGQDVVAELAAGLRPEVLVLDAFLSDTGIFSLLHRIRKMQLDYAPHIVVIMMPNTVQLIPKMLTLGAECIIFKPYDLPGLFDTVFQTAAVGARLQHYLLHQSLAVQLHELGCHRGIYGLHYLEWAVYISVFGQSACSLGELCARAGEPFGTDGCAVRSALERLNARMHKIGRPAYGELCALCGKPADARLTVGELLDAMAVRTRRDLCR